MIAELKHGLQHGRSEVGMQALADCITIALYQLRLCCGLLVTSKVDAKQDGCRRETSNGIAHKKMHAFTNRLQLDM